MIIDHLEFEQPIFEIEAKIDELHRVEQDSELELSSEIAKLSARRKVLSDSIYGNLTPWQVAQIARHPRRPYTLDYVEHLFTDFEELHGDRAYADDSAIITGLARFEGRSVVVIGHQKGRNTKENLERNFGMPRPEGYRKALRVMKMAEKFQLPVMTFIDTPGAYPGVGAEERGQAQAIAQNLYEMARLRTPIICHVIGEGGSGGALAIGVGDHLSMLSYSTYSVISPEGCASILWKSADKAEEAATTLGITAERLMELGLIDEIIPEPQSGAHRNLEQTCKAMRVSISANLERMAKLEVNQMLAKRYERLTSYGAFKK
ncbi:MAG: acetyl-CoA carboxylase carboxyltransferase subunit alpha [Gammaproteobacteria bacterium]|nr:acetyl-CoA carboxylase carboxyltransferase subunit alpha [Gammaproteobacteria bacterium]